jgi:isopenicillin N synthase-like dioxygenase
MAATEHLEQSAPSRAVARDRIPVIDLAPLFSGTERVGSLTARFREASLETGFFYVKNTCVEDSVIINALDAMKAFFDSPDEGHSKQSVHNELAGGMKGWGPMFGEPAYQQGTVAHMESFDFGQQLSESEYKALGIEPNIWPDIPAFRQAALIDGAHRRPGSFLKLPFMKQVNEYGDTGKQQPGQQPRAAEDHSR